MTRKVAAIVSVVVIVLFIFFMVYDSITDKTFTDKPVDDGIYPGEIIEPVWEVSATIDFTEGTLNAVTISSDGHIVAGGSNFITMLGNNSERLWTRETEKPVTALCPSDESLYAACGDIIQKYSLDGTLLSEWGPYEDKSIITSISANKENLVFADAGMRRVYILNKKGELKSFFGHEGEKFVIPSPYFDVHITSGDTIFITNPGKTRIETRDLSGNIVSMFGEPGTDAAAYCGCCNPSHFTIMENGNFVTSEKGINRIKIMSKEGELVEFVSIQEQFQSTQPMDLIVDAGGIIYGASSYDSRLYIFKRKDQ